MLSVIIVNYNVKYFLEQCLCSVKKATDELSIVNLPAGRQGSEWRAEVLVVDNSSSDDSIGYLSSRFPFATFISNTENTGFAKANNRALQQATGKYILFLNPDTIVPEDGFVQCIRFMEAHADAGALGVYMLDGSGRFLKESKRGFPSPWASFCKMSGLINLFPSSKLFAGYYAGHLPDTTQHEADVLSGAFMLVRKDVLDKTGGFDERFFMYAEDIDLSYRIQQAGYKNYYFPGCTIIHFKGESTQKDSRYVQLFYKAMIQFVQKHFSGSVAWFYTGLLKMAIWWKAMWAPKAGNPPFGQTGATYNLSDEDICCMGDEQSISEVKAILAKEEITPDVILANDVIFCEGNAFTFKDCIGGFKSWPNKQKFIHGKGTSSIVGSHSKMQQGKILVED